jgi:putative DNA primase/helicase
VNSTLEPDEQLELLARIWDSHQAKPGWLFMPTISGSARTKQERRYSYREGPALHWPDDRNEVRQRLWRHEDDDLYFTPALFNSVRRLGDHTAAEGCLWADLDAVQPHPDHDLQPTIAWETSPARYQGIWLMDTPKVGASWPRHENHRLTAYLGADPSGWDSTQLLRVPGRLNHKPDYGEEPVAGLLLWDDGPTYSWIDFADLPQIEGDDGVWDVADADIDAVDVEAVWKAMKNKVSRQVRAYVIQQAEPLEGEDRSGKIWHIQRALVEAGCSQPEVAALVRGTVWWRSKYGGRIDELSRLRAEVSKAMAQPPPEVEEGAGAMLPAPTEPLKVARVIARDREKDGQPTLRYWQRDWWQWEGSHWTLVEQDKLEAQLYARLEHAVYDSDGKERAWAPDEQKLRKLRHALAAVLRPETPITGVPAWLTDDAPHPAHEFVACANGLLHAPTRDLLPHTPRFFNQAAVPFAYDPKAPKPTRWLKFLNELWPGDDEAHTLLQEWFGYVLSGRTDLQKLMLIKGPPRSGKGTIQRVITALLGADNVTQPTLTSLNTNFGLWPLVDKSLAVVGDAHAGPGVHQTSVLERLKGISGEDAQTFDRKYLKHWSGKLPTRFMLMANQLPQFDDPSGAIVKRLLLLVMANDFYGREQHDLGNQLMTELPGILLWALDGLERLMEWGVFTAPKSSRDSLAEMHHLVSPIRGFVEECCRLSGKHEVAVNELFAAYRTWCENHGVKTSSTQVFGRDLRAAFPKLRIAQHRNDEGVRERYYVGLRLISKGLGQ